MRDRFYGLGANHPILFLPPCKAQFKPYLSAHCQVSELCVCHLLTQEQKRGRSAQSLRSSHDEAFLLLSTIRGCFDAGDSQQLNDIISDKEYKGLVEYIAWDLLPILGPHLSDKEKNREMYNNCIDILGQLSQLGNPKEMFIGLLEQVDRFLDSLVHSDFLQPLQTVIRRLGLTKPLYYNQLLTTLYAHMEILKLPSVNGMGAMERRLISQDPDYSKVETTTLALLEFLAPLVHDVREVLVTNVVQQSYTPKDILEIGGTRTEIIKFVLNLLDNPLIAIEFKYQNDAEEEEVELEELEGVDDEPGRRIALRGDDYSISKTSAEQCMFFLDSMGCSFTFLMFYANKHAVNLDTLDEQLKRKARRKQDDEDEDDDDDEDEVKADTLPVLGLSCFAYMILVEGYETHRMPTIYSAVHMMQVVMPYVEAMLRRTEEPVISKGLELLTSLVARLDEQSLHSSLIDTRQNFLKVPECLVQIMVYCPSKSIRRMSVSLLPSYIDCFDWKGRYHLLRSLLITTAHSGVRGMLIGTIKDYVHCSLQSDSSNDWFTGSRAHHLYSMIFKLDRGINTDLLNHADKQIKALNFLRYLLLRDSPDQNVTGIWSRIESLQTTYLTPLHTCLDMSKAHYALELKSTHKEIQQATREHQRLKGKLTVGSHQFPTMPLPEQVKVLECAQYTFDLIASILGRVGEIISSVKKSPTEAASFRSSPTSLVDSADSVAMDT